MLDTIKNFILRLCGYNDKEWVMNEIDDENETKPKEPVLIDYPDCRFPAPFDKSFIVMTIADSHGKLMQKDIIAALNENAMPDYVFLLGDNAVDDIEAVLEVFKDKGVPILGVAGNHDKKTILEQFGRIEDIHGRQISTNGIAVGGLSGSIKYKDDDYYALLTNEESEAVMREMPPCDILLTHDKPCFNEPKEVTAHSGLTGIGTYINEKSPRFVLHGHLHERYIKKYKNTIIRCCYGVEVFEIAY